MADLRRAAPRGGLDGGGPRILFAPSVRSGCGRTGTVDLGGCEPTVLRLSQALRMASVDRFDLRSNRRSSRRHHDTCCRRSCAAHGSRTFDDTPPCGSIIVAVRATGESRRRYQREAGRCPRAFAATLSDRRFWRMAWRSGCGVSRTSSWRSTGVSSHSRPPCRPHSSRSSTARPTETTARAATNLLDGCAATVVAFDMGADEGHVALR